MRFFRPSLLWLSAGLALSLVSCDEVKDVAGDVADKAKELVGSESEATKSEVVAVTEKEGKVIIAEEPRLVVVKFYSDTSESCKEMAPVLERLAEANKENIKVLKVDVYDNPGWAQSEKIGEVLPHVQFYKAGHKMYEFSGGMREDELNKQIQHFAVVTAATAAQGPVEPAPPAIQPMPKDWLPPGIKRGQKPVEE